MAAALGVNLKVGELSTHFLYDDIRIYVLLDPSHMLKPVRNAFASERYFIDGEGGLGSGGCEATVKFICLFNDVFDILNSRNLLSKEFKSPIKESNSGKIFTRLGSLKSYVASLKSKDGLSILQSKRKTGFLGMVVAGECVCALFRDLRGSEKLPTDIQTEPGSFRILLQHHQEHGSDAVYKPIDLGKGGRFVTDCHEHRRPTRPSQPPNGIPMHPDPTEPESTAVPHLPEQRPCHSQDLMASEYLAAPSSPVLYLPKRQLCHSGQSEYLAASPDLYLSFVFDGKTKELPCPSEPFVSAIGQGETAVTENLSNCAEKKNLSSLIIPIQKLIIAKSPARSFIKCTKGHTGYSGCERCVVKGEQGNHRMVFCDVDAELRNDTSFRNYFDQDHHSGETPLLTIECLDMVSQFPLDYMHLAQAYVRLWRSSRNEISDRLAIPSDFSQIPRGLDILKRWKATEFRTFLLYIGPVALKNILTKDLYDHFLLAAMQLFKEAKDERIAFEGSFFERQDDYYTYPCKSSNVNTIGRFTPCEGWLRGGRLLKQCTSPALAIQSLNWRGRGKWCVLDELA
ncbi:hypothetical protein J437_LFUL012928 [Ladona fulva]|uniref:Transposable element P transposase-like GTP-binding insertion domain-containing protein n=1 Tax=Ladona fulva TaxID=123851 RepID=A0A8K0P4U2_LADFU|nr:hypothetical protein J437_LFUL012928 [Ladona fulva]